jgi:hypothetical protein
MSEFDNYDEPREIEDLFRKIWRRAKGASESGDELVGTPEEKEYNEWAKDFLESIPPDLSEDEFIDFVRNTYLPAPPEDDIIWDFRNLN